MSHVIRKPVFCKCENKDVDQLRSNCAADQLLCFHYIDSIVLLLSVSKKLKPSYMAAQPDLCWTCLETGSSVPKIGFLMLRLKIQHANFSFFSLLYGLIRNTLAMIKSIVILKQTGHLLHTTPIKWIYYTL